MGWEFGAIGVEGFFVLPEEVGRRGRSSVVGKDCGLSGRIFCALFQRFGKKEGDRWVGEMVGGAPVRDRGARDDPLSDELRISFRTTTDRSEI